MATTLLYLEDFDVTEANVAVMKVYDVDDARQVLELDQTCFYPRGGGQDWDQGVIRGSDAEFTIEQVRLDEDGTVQHIGRITRGTYSAGDAVACAVDTVRRQANTRLHSAGHLIDMAIDQLKLPWVPGKGAHYPHMSFVEYNTGEFVVDEVTKQTIQVKVNELLAHGDYDNKIMFIPVGEMGKYCRHVPNNIPTNKPARIVLYADDFGIPCGGTHVRRVRDIGEVEITKVKSKKGITKVSYAVKGING